MTTGIQAGPTTHNLWTPPKRSVARLCDALAGWKMGGTETAWIRPAAHSDTVF